MPFARARAPRSALLAVTVAAFAAAALGGCRDRDPNTPIAVAFTPFGQGGVVEVRYTLRNQDTAGVSIDVVVFRSEGGSFAATEAPGGEGTVGLEASPGGTAHIFRWDAAADLGPGQHVVSLQIIPRLGRRGTTAQTGTFTVFNTDLPERLPDLAVTVARGAASVGARGAPLLSGGAGFSGQTSELADGAAAVETRAALVVARERHAQATALPDALGTASPIVFGGVGGAGALASVEAYDASQDLWAEVTPPLAAPRLDHTATVLESGVHVLLAGGRSDLAGALAATDVVYDARGGAAEVVIAGPAAARTGHTATLLPDGRVLVAGGADAAGAPLASTLIVTFDAVGGAGSAAPGPTLVTARTGHAAVVLGETLLVFGGAVDASGTATDTAESILVDAAFSATSTFALVTDAGTGAVARMTAARGGHRAAALGDTQALLGGGVALGVALASLERFVLSAGASSTAAASGRFTASRQPMAVARSLHEMVPFGPGAVLLASGGSAAVEVYRSAESGLGGGARPEAALADGRDEHTATLLADGRVLLAGGTDGVVESASSTLRALDAAVIFDPARAPAERFVATGALAAARRAHAAARAGNGQVVLAGGIGADGLPRADLERFDPSAADGAGAFATSTQSFAGGGRAGLAAAALDDGRVLFAGGVQSGGATTSDAFVYDAGADLLAPLAPMQAARASFALVALADGRVLAAGGDTGGTVEVFDPADGATGSWTLVADPGGAFGAPRTHLAAIALATGRVLLAGGFDAAGDPVADVAVFDPSDDTLEALAPLAVARAGAVGIRTGLASEERAFLAGGATRRPAGAISPLALIRTASIEVYDAAAGGSTAPAFDRDLTSPVSGAAAVRLNDGSLLLTGGRERSGAVRVGAERIGP